MSKANQTWEGAKPTKPFSQHFMSIFAKNKGAPPVPFEKKWDLLL